MDCALNMEEDRQTFALKLTSTCESEMFGASSAHTGTLLSARSHIIDTMHCYPPPSREQGLAQIPVKTSPMNHILTLWFSMCLVITRSYITNWYNCFRMKDVV